MCYLFYLSLVLYLPIDLVSNWRLNICSFPGVENPSGVLLYRQQKVVRKRDDVSR